MKINKAPDCLEKLNGLFDRTTQDFTFASALCDMLYEVEKQANKFTKLRQQILNEHYDLQDNGNYKVKGVDETQHNTPHLSEANKKWQELDKLEFTIKKVEVTRPEYVSPRELYYLKEFFIFE